MRKKLFLFIHKAMWVIGILLVAILLLSIAWVAIYSQLKVSTTPQMISYKFEDKSMKVQHEWIPLDSMSRNVIVAFLAAEDKNFYIHDGFAPIETITDSITEVELKEQKTITQQAAHLVFLTQGNSKIKNTLESYFTIMAEYLWGKNRILEIYLNTVLLGDGIFGLEAASQFYFDKKASDLNKQEAVWLAAIANSSAKVDLNNPSKALKQRQRAISLEMGLMMHIKLGKQPIDEKNPSPLRPIYRKKWNG